MCPYYLDGELLPCPKARSVLIRRRARRHGRRKYPYLAFVQFSSFAEAVERRSSARGPSKLSSDARSTLGKCLPRKEVIQPQLPLRLPCYDFTPITSPTFDGCLPKGLAHRLRVLPAFVV